MSRPIVRNPVMLGGRWHLESTSISVAQIRADINRMSKEDVLRSYAFMHLSENEYEAVRTFDFTAVRQTMTAPAFATVVVECECGEDTLVALQGHTGVGNCICGRDWEVELIPMVWRYKTDRPQPSANNRDGVGEPAE
jgi:hypothetical protein